MSKKNNNIIEDKERSLQIADFVLRHSRMILNENREKYSKSFIKIINNQYAVEEERIHKQWLKHQNQTNKGS